jgi:hypothetical protein
MPVAVIAAFLVFVSSLAVSGEGGCICAPQTSHSGVTTLTGQPRCDQSAHSAPGEANTEPIAMPGGIALIAIAFAVMLGTIEVLFRCSIHERQAAPKQAPSVIAKSNGTE